jgi:RND family efflux transporter MFP subunit
MTLALCPTREELQDYIRGKMPDDASDSLAEHLDGCLQCQAELAALPDSDDTLIAQLQSPETPDPYVVEPKYQEALVRAKSLFAACGAGGGISPDGSTTFLNHQLGEYLLIERLGRGGMGTVYKARQQKLDRVVALKILSHGRTGDAHAVVRFEREMKAIGRLDHPNIVQAYDAREIDGTLVLIMEFIDGLDLSEIARRVGPLPMADACELVRQTAIALQYAHEHGLVHRDIKPSNIMLSRSGEVKLLDLGLARFFAESIPSGATEILPVPSSEGATADVPLVTAEEMTSTGQAMGTADYMAPEQASDSRSVDIRADIYSLGCTLYKLLSGRAPFGGPEYRGTLDKMNAHVHETPPPLKQFVPELPDELAAIIDRMLAKNPADRFATPAEVAEALEHVGQFFNLSNNSGQASSLSNPTGQIENLSYEADLPALIHRALTLPREQWAKAEKSQDANFITPRPATSPTRRHPIVKYIFLGMGFLGLLGLAFAAGIWITIKKNGETHRLQVPGDSQTVIDENGNPTVQLKNSVSKEKLATAAAPKTPLEFSPEKEVLLNAFEVMKIDDKDVPHHKNHNNENAALCLATGKVIGFDANFGKMSDKEQEDWMEKNNIDLIVCWEIHPPLPQQELPREHGLLCPIGLKLVSVVNERWNRITAEEMQTELDSPVSQWLRDDLGPTAYVGERVGKVYYRLENRLPLTFAFKTRKGDVGLLQVLRYTEDPKGMRIRYKLAIPSAPNADTDESHQSQLSLELLGLELRPIPAEEFRTINKGHFRGGLSIVAVRPNSPASSQGLRVGDVLVGLNSSETVTMENMSRILNQHDFASLSPVKFFILRGGETLYGYFSLPHLTTYIDPYARYPQKPTGEENFALGLGDIFRSAKPLSIAPVVEQKSVQEHSFQTAKITRGDITATITATGTVEPDEVVDVYAPVSGKIEKLFVDYNSPVEKDQLLAKIENPELQAKLADEQRANERVVLELKNTTEVLDLAKKAADFAKSQHDSGLINEGDLIQKQKEMAQAKAAFDTAQANLKKSNAAMEMAAKNVALMEVKSPIKGVVIARRVNTGQNVAADDKDGGMFLIAKDSSNMRVWALVNEADIGRIHEGMDASFTVDAFPDKIVKGKVTQVRLNAQQSQNVVLYTAVITFDNSKAKLMPYMTANVRFEIVHRKSVLLVPNAALLWKPKPNMLPPSWKSEGYDTLWTKSEDGIHVNPIHVKFDLSDGKQTVVIGPEDLEGKEIIVGDNKPVDPSENPFKPVLRKPRTQPQGHEEAAGNTPVQPANTGKMPVLPAVDLLADLKAIKGKWKVVKVDKEKDANMYWAYSTPASPETATFFDFVQTDENFERAGFPEIVTMEGFVPECLPHEEKFQFSYRINPAAATKTIDLFEYWEMERKINGLAALGIYDLQGDKLKICLTKYRQSLDETAQRPQQFAAGPNSTVVFHLEHYKPSEDEKKIQGEWAIHAQIEDGKPIDEEKLKSRICIFHTPSIRIRERESNGEIGLLDGNYSLDEAKEPKRITITNYEDPEGNYKKCDYPGIYKFDGDRLTIAYRKNDPTPEKFESTPGSGVTLLELKRSEPENKTEEKPAEKTKESKPVDSAAEWKALQGKWKVVEFKKGKESSFEDARLVMLDGRACEIMGMEWQEHLLKAYNIDPTKSPKTIDLLTFNSVGQGGELASHGIYEFDGEHLKLCFRTYIRTLSSDQRPNSFTVDLNSGDACYVLEREQPLADDKLLQGDWNVVSDIEEGKSLAVDPLRNLKLRFADHKTVKWQDATTLGCGGSYVLDPTTTPPRITIFTQDWHQSDGIYRPGSAAFIGIYRFDGDKLTIAYRKSGAAPEKFESTPGSGVTLLELKQSESKPIPDIAPKQEESEPPKPSTH